MGEPVGGVQGAQCVTRSPAAACGVVEDMPQFEELLVVKKAETGGPGEALGLECLWENPTFFHLSSCCCSFCLPEGAHSPTTPTPTH